MTADLDQLAALHAEADPGPWWTGDHHATGQLAVQNETSYVAFAGRPETVIAIAAIHNALPDLLKELTDARATLAMARKIADGTDGRPRPSVERIRDLRQLLSLA